MQLAVRDAPKLRSRLGRVHDGGLSRFSAEAALGDVEARARQPIRVGQISGRFEDSFGFLPKHDAKAFDHFRPEVLPVLRGPSMEFRIGTEMALPHDRTQVRSPNRFGRRDPCRTRSVLGFPTFDGNPVGDRLTPECASQHRILIDETTEFEPKSDLRLRVRPVFMASEDVVHSSSQSAGLFLRKARSFELRGRHGGAHAREYGRRLLSLRRWRKPRLTPRKIALTLRRRDPASRRPSPSLLRRAPVRPLPFAFPPESMGTTPQA